MFFFPLFSNPGLPGKWLIERRVRVRIKLIMIDVQRVNNVPDLRVKWVTVVQQQTAWMCRQCCHVIRSTSTQINSRMSSEDRMIVAGVVLAWYRTVTDGQTDGQTVGQTESIMANTALCSLHSKLCWRAVKINMTIIKQCRHLTNKNKNKANNETL